MTTISIESRTELDAAFASRHIGPTAREQETMLATLGYRDLDQLIDAALPNTLRCRRSIELPAARSESDTLGELRALAKANRTGEPMIGLGYYGTVTPAVIRRNVLEDPAWYTAYTPYQPEISQGRLEALLNFQTMVADLTGLPVANASLLDEATAVVEAVLLMRRMNRSTPAIVIVDADCFPQTHAVLATRCAAAGIRMVVDDLAAGLPEQECFGVVVQYPGASGRVRDWSRLCADARRRGVLVAAAADLLALTLLSPPGEWGADIAVGTSQRFGVPLGYGGPHAAYMAVRQGLERALPGRLVGVSVDADGAPAYRLALQTREQHIRRDKATSNICTAQVLLAIIASMYAVYHGADGLRRIARAVNYRARTLAAALNAGGLPAVWDQFFDTITVRVPGKAQAIVDSAERLGVQLRLVDADHVGISCSETTTQAHLHAVTDAFGVLIDPTAPADLPDSIPAQLRREGDILTHPTFRAYRSETELLRYLRRLSDEDFALDRGMIPLGSCTMKLNAASEMEAISFAGFADIHPFAPAESCSGYLALIEQLETWLAELTGYARVSVQPNAGSQGELAGLLAIRAYHQACGQHERDVCLIPASAHGTNAASAVLAGMRVVIVDSQSDGTIDPADLRTKCTQHADTLAAIMITYPSTHGVYEAGIRELCNVVHAHGGQVYIDGANLNALLGLATLGELGGDVSHLNLHKTFCIPHGGGGPGVGPVAVAAHLAPYLPSHPYHPDPVRRHGTGPVSAAPIGSAGILPITWAYLRMMSTDGLLAATKAAVLSANYLAARLAPHYPILYRGPTGLVAHEFILDLRPATAATGVTVDDVAKRLIDYGFHAPTVSFPVAGTLMIEPTESESLPELDRFVAAMIDIAEEIREIGAGRWTLSQSPLRGAPHTAAALAGDWHKPYTRLQAAFPSGRTRGKYWPPVSRIDQARGDRNLICSCPPPEAFES